MEIFDVAIIGAGPVGLFTAFQAGMNELKSCIIDTLEDVGGQCTALYPEKPIYDIPGFSLITAQQLIKNLQDQLLPFSCKMFLNETCISIKKVDKLWVLRCKHNLILAKTIIIAAGAGFFRARKPPLANIEEFEKDSVFYHVANKEKFRNKIVTIAGGGDSALDWALVLATDVAKKVNLVHRRNSFSALQRTVSSIKKLGSTGQINLVTPFQLSGLRGKNNKLTHISVKSLEGEEQELKTDFLLPFFGMSTHLGLIHDWGLEISQKHIKVEHETMQTCLTGVYAVGDICHYPGKLKFISTGFAEATRAVHSAYDFINPNVTRHFEHSTTKGVKSNV